MSNSEFAGEFPGPADLLDVEKLEADFFRLKPDADNPAQRVSFGTSGHRGSAFSGSFNEDHILAITQAICLYRAQKGINGPLFIGRDTHALSAPAFDVALEVLSANGVLVMVDAQSGYTPTPTVSHAILGYNKGRNAGLADGIVITPSHNPPEDGGFKYDPPHGGPADSDITGWIERKANDLLRNGLVGVKRGNIQTSLIKHHDYVGSYVGDLASVVDMDAIAKAGVRIGVDPLGGAAIGYWKPIAERYGLNLTVTDPMVDPTFRMVPRDWDGKVRMDCSSRFPMKKLLARKGEFDIAFANDTDADRHGIVTAAGLMPSNDYLATCAYYLGRERQGFASRKIGKTIVSSSVIDRVAAKLGTSLYEVPVGFKWFVAGLHSAELYFSGEESAGACFLRRDGNVWVTDKDGLIAGLLAAEMVAKTGKKPDGIFAELTGEFGPTFYARIDSPADLSVRTKLGKIKADDVAATTLAGDAVTAKVTNAPGNGAAIGGIKISTDKGWIAARPSGTEDIYKIYAESFVSEAHLKALQDDARRVVDGVAK